ncbi:NADPH-dependent FMN reductase [Secundilactobacillus paracollinoides]|uniref:Flavin reductase n=1 Tax=Secundilactobacillus paracollinoides TaxID=240427 RepID=A0A1B2IYB8_9LACO|nr:NADPH-dependent FMN reductase [Secundilactobacillus paracollinoides]ANZ61112.1 flavin reductase [Secundilactobacillus paracollinoides]ANZ67033.1 flavin reductase [Secundilactobacillus paracollinoides]
MAKVQLVGIVGNNAPFSYNRMLLSFMQQHFNDQITLDICEIDDIPLFNESHLAAVPDAVATLSLKIKAADGVIIATPEYDHAIPACLKSTIEWLSVYEHALSTKPVMIVGASLGVQGTARAQDNLRQILNSPGVNGFVMPGFEFLLNCAKDKFDEEGTLTDFSTVKFLRDCVDHFLVFVRENEKAFASENR